MTPSLDQGTKEPKYNQLARQIETYLTNRAVPTGTRLPSERLLAELFGIPVRPVVRGDLLKAVPENIADETAFVAEKVKVVSSGCAAGTLKGKDFIPDADLALDICLREDAFRRVDVDRRTALSFLHRDAIVLDDMEKGYVLICHGGVPLGFVKNLGNRCNSLHPMERRIRMSID